MRETAMQERLDARVCLPVVVLAAARNPSTNISAVSSRPGVVFIGSWVGVVGWNYREARIVFSKSIVDSYRS